MSVIDRIDPEFTDIVCALPRLDLVDIARSRATLDKIFGTVDHAQLNSAIERESHYVPGIAGAPDVLVRISRPVGAGDLLPCVIWISGGGYVLTVPSFDDELCGELACANNCAVASVIYRRAPEARFPAASDDCYAAVNWLFTHSDRLRVDPSRIVIAGASAGGGAAAATALRVRDEGRHVISHQHLIYPMLDDRTALASDTIVTDPELWNNDSNRLAWKAYLGEHYGTDNVSPYAAPARAATLKGLPPTTILIGELDLFLVESIDYARRLIDSGVSTEMHVYAGAHHGFDIHKPGARVSRQFHADRNTAISRSLKRVLQN